MKHERIKHVKVEKNAPDIFPQNTSRWCVMKAFQWSTFEIASNHPLILKQPVTMPEGGPQRFIPVFDTREQAVAFEDGDETFVQELKMSNPESVPCKVR